MDGIPENVEKLSSRLTELINLALEKVRTNKNSGLKYSKTINNFDVPPKISKTLTTETVKLLMINRISVYLKYS